MGTQLSKHAAFCFDYKSKLKSVISNWHPKTGFSVSLEFETSPTYGVLYRRLRDAMQEREAELLRNKQIDPVLFREVRDLKNMMQLIKAAFEQSIKQWTN